MILFPNAKINIGLNIVSKRADGFHNLETLMYPIGLTDIITLNKIPSANEKLKFTATGLVIDGAPENNLIAKAYHLLDSQYQLPPIQIHLHKTIPFGAGLGGGSADGSFTIKGLNTLFNLNLTENEMESFAAQLGSDTPFFIRNNPALAKGRGELLSSYNMNLSQYHIAVVVPNVAISTKMAYSKVTAQQPDAGLLELLNQPIETWKDGVKNDFEFSIFSQFPEIKTLKETLYNQGAVYAAMSGSGSAVFGIFKNPINLKSLLPKNYFVWMGLGKV